MEAVPSFKVGDTWPTLGEAKAAALRYIVARGESWRSYKDSKNRHWVVVCKTRAAAGCAFRLRINRCREHWRLTVHEPHTCPPDTHHHFRNAHSTTLIAGDPFYRALIAQDPGLKAAAIRDHEWMRFGNRIPYLQAWRALEELKRDVLGLRAPPGQAPPPEEPAEPAAAPMPAEQLAAEALVAQQQNAAGMAGLAQQQQQPQPQQQQLSTLEKIDPALLLATREAEARAGAQPVIPSAGWHLTEITGFPAPTAPMANVDTPVKVPKKRGRKPKPKPAPAPVETPQPT